MNRQEFIASKIAWTAVVVVATLALWAFGIKPYRMRQFDQTRKAEQQRRIEFQERQDAARSAAQTAAKDAVGPEFIPGLAQQILKNLDEKNAASELAPKSTVMDDALTAPNQ